MASPAASTRQKIQDADDDDSTEVGPIRYKSRGRSALSCRHRSGASSRQVSSRRQSASLNRQVQSKRLHRTEYLKNEATDEWSNSDEWSYDDGEDQRDLRRYPTQVLPTSRSPQRRSSRSKERKRKQWHIPRSTESSELLERLCKNGEVEVHSQPDSVPVNTSRYQDLLSSQQEYVVTSPSKSDDSLRTPYTDVFRLLPFVVGNVRNQSKLYNSHPNICLIVSL